MADSEPFSTILGAMHRILRSVASCASLVVVSALVLTACSNTPPPSRQGFVASDKLRSTQPLAGERSVKASYYYGKWHGKRTASGVIYDQMSWTAAHKTLPLGTRIRVRLPRTGRAVLLTINNRGPYVEGRELDLSLAAARELGFEAAGVAQVMMKVLDRDPRYSTYQHDKKLEGEAPPWPKAELQLVRPQARP